MIQPVSQPVVEPVSQVELAASGELLRHITTPPPSRIDSLLAKRMSARKVLTLDEMLVDWISLVKEGTANAIRMAAMVTTTRSSTKVKPRECRMGWSLTPANPFAPLPTTNGYSGLTSGAAGLQRCCKNRK